MFDTYWYDYVDCADIKELIAKAIATSRTEYVWLRHRAVDYNNFNLRFIPSRHQLKMIHAWASHDNPLCYTTWLIPVENNGNMVFHDQILPIITPPQWDTSDQVLYDGFNFNWYPDVWDWNKQHHFAMAGTTQLSYTSVGNGSEIKYHPSELRCKAIGIWYDVSSIDDSPYEWNWIADNRIDYADFNWNWLPDAWDADKIHEFCMYGSKHLSYTRLMNKNNNGKRIFHHSYIQFKPNVTPVIYWQDFFEELSLDNLKQLAQGNEWTWIADKRIDYGDWNFDWLPDGWDTNYIHCFTMSGKEQLSYTWLVHRDAIANFVDYKYHESQLKFKDAHADMCFCNTNTFTNPLVVDFQVRLITTMEEVIRAAVKKSNREWLWIYSDVCDYDRFDWTWLPDLDQRDQIHCWPSGTCEKGDTFLIHVPSFDPDKLKFNFDHSFVFRKKWPLVRYDSDNLTQALNYKSNGIYTLMHNGNIGPVPDVCLWDKRPVVSLNNSNSSCLVPRDCIVKSEIYEYPYLLKIEEDIKTQYDIVFISYDETQADENYVKLLKSYPHAKRVHGVEGMENALAAAAKCSNTDYFYAVFAKTRLYDGWNFTTEPDYWRDPRNYIFYAINTSNDLIYGEMGIVLYNKKFLMSAPSYDELGIDFTMSFPIQVIPQISAYGEFATDSYRAWRTAFRETCKLAYFNSESPCVETLYRIHQWRNHAHGNYAMDVLRGANDGYEYFINNSDNLSALKKTFRWDWLKNYYNSKYN